VRIHEILMSPNLLLDVLTARIVRLESDVTRENVVVISWIVRVVRLPGERY